MPLFNGQRLVRRGELISGPRGGKFNRRRINRVVTVDDLYRHFYRSLETFTFSKLHCYNTGLWINLNLKVSRSILAQFETSVFRLAYHRDCIILRMENWSFRLQFTLTWLSVRRLNCVIKLLISRDKFDGGFIFSAITVNHLYWNADLCVNRVRKRDDTGIRIDCSVFCAVRKLSIKAKFRTNWAWRPRSAVPSFKRN